MADRSLPSSPPPAILRRTEPWQEWPSACRNFNAAFQDDREVRAKFCRCLDYGCASCDPREAMYVSVYSVAGQCISEGNVDAAGLGLHLQAVGQLGAASGGADALAPRYRLYFPCDVSTEGCVRTPYIRRLFSHYHAPAELPLALSTLHITLGFQSLTETDVPSRGRVLHCWMKCAVQLDKEDLRSDLEFFSESMRALEIARAENNMSALEGPALYLTYDYESGQCAVLSTDCGTVYRALREACRRPEQTLVSADPFVFFVVFVRRLLDATRRSASQWKLHMNEVTRFLTDPNVIVNKEYHARFLNKFATDRIAYARIGDAMDGLVRDLDRIVREHRAWAKHASAPLRPALPTQPAPCRPTCTTRQEARAPRAPAPPPAPLPKRAPPTSHQARRRRRPRQPT